MTAIEPTRSPSSARLISIDEARRLLGGVSRNTIYNRIGDGTLRAVKVGRRRMIVADSIDALASSSSDAPSGMRLVIDDPAVIAAVAGIVAAGEDA